MEPPPAATVLISIIGALILTPANSVSKDLSYSPAKWQTSVDVPPISKPINLLYPACFPVSVILTTPPAGPERRASLPWNKWASVKPPLDCININFVDLLSLSSSETWLTYLLRIGERYASTTVVSPLPTNLISGDTLWLIEIWLKFSSLAISAILFSCSEFT